MNHDLKTNNDSDQVEHRCNGSPQGHNFHKYDLIELINQDTDSNIALKKICSQKNKLQQILMYRTMF
uniref:Uncharacterized protein n=1 Tax=Physcomitrium patens TaxID=3218 RepID=A0A2K1JXI9_PHYPA|nr:hypothetical protein PHYPA_013359 [Physcomitrium patens]